MCIKGKALLTVDGVDYAMNMGDTYFVPANSGKVTIEAENAQVIATTM